jgi:hypothetical protein
MNLGVTFLVNIAIQKWYLNLEAFYFVLLMTLWSGVWGGFGEVVLNGDLWLGSAEQCPWQYWRQAIGNFVKCITAQCRVRQLLLAHLSVLWLETADLSLFFSFSFSLNSLPPGSVKLKPNGENDKDLQTSGSIWTYHNTCRHRTFDSCPPAQISLTLVCLQPHQQ